jgi:hypothetical protein
MPIFSLILENPEERGQHADANSRQDAGAKTSIVKDHGEGISPA